MLSNRLGLALPSNDAKALFDACADDLLGKVRGSVCGVPSTLAPLF